MILVDPLDAGLSSGRDPAETDGERGGFGGRLVRAREGVVVEQDVDIAVAVGDRNAAGLPRGAAAARAQAFRSVELAAGESREVQLTVRREDLAIRDVRSGTWTVEGGTYAVSVAASSRDVRLVAETEVVGDAVSVPLSLGSSVQEVLADPEAAAVVQGASTVCSAARAPPRRRRPPRSSRTPRCSSSSGRHPSDGSSASRARA
ncbi:fibronectin type III-like domain-contianing protein [Terrabacter sp. MAHUQ-38]|nr:fibronectin type III-like domain-contianing protein [Terrabacter sp. MAHUQ-38]